MSRFLLLQKGFLTSQTTSKMSEPTQEYNDCQAEMEMLIRHHFYKVDGKFAKRCLKESGYKNWVLIGEKLYI